MATIQRVARLAVIVSAIAGMVCPNSLATGASTNVSMKKSNASSVQPRNPARIALRAPDGEDCFSPAMSVRLPLHRPRHQQRHRKRAHCGDNRQNKSVPIPPETELSDPDKRRAHDDPAHTPAQ